MSQVVRKPRSRKTETTKKTTSVLLDREVVDFFKSKGKDWRDRINSLLRAFPE